jgi:hypothetical protein
VELVKSVAKTETRASDQFMEDLFLAEGLPLVHIPLNDRYETTDLVHLFQFAVAKAKEANRAVRRPGSDSAPTCPVCGKMMVLRIHREGAKAGKKYYGCMDNPHCPGAIAIE